ncbi:hypothetical protein BH23BAC1_BH23BAC1_22870 [soil metagenome]
MIGFINKYLNKWRLLRNFRLPKSWCYSRRFLGIKAFQAKKLIFKILYIFSSVRGFLINSLPKDFILSISEVSEAAERILF